MDWRRDDLEGKDVSVRVGTREYNFCGYVLDSGDKMGASYGSIVYGEKREAEGRSIGFLLAVARPERKPGGLRPIRTGCI